MSILAILMSSQKAFSHAKTQSSQRQSIVIKRKNFAPWRLCVIFWFFLRNHQYYFLPHPPIPKRSRALFPCCKTAGLPQVTPSNGHPIITYNLRNFSISHGNFDLADHRVLLLETICVSPVGAKGLSPLHWFLQHGRPRLRSAAEENGEGPMLQKP